MNHKTENTNNKEYKQNCDNLGFKNFHENFFSKNFTKSSQSNIHMSEKSTVNTIINSHKNKKQNNFEVEFNQKNLGIITKNINKAFEALEKLLLNDSNNENNKEITSIEYNSFSNNNCNKNDNRKKGSYDSNYNLQNKINLKSNKKTKSISIPKLDFSMILDYYQSNKIIVKEIKIDDINDYENNVDYNILENIKNNHHKHHKHHYNFHQINL